MDCGSILVFEVLSFQYLMCVIAIKEFSYHFKVFLIPIISVNKYRGGWGVHPGGL